MALFDDFDWGAFGKGALNTVMAVAPTAIAGYFGAKNVQKANQNAANTYAQANQQAADAVAAANARAASTLAASNQAATGEMQQLKTVGAPGTSYIRNILATPPGQLTPEQNIELSDATRDTMMRTRAGPLSGSGRTVAALNSDLVNRTKARMIGENRSRSDRAAGVLNNLYSEGTRGSASLAERGGAQQAGLISDTGRTVAGANMNVGESNANATTATAASNNTALGTLASVIAAQNERDRRESRYKDWNTPRA